MGAKTKIAWTDATWNPVTGCTEVSPGCDHCYARGVAERFGVPAYPNGFDITLRPERLDVPLRWGRPRMVFVNSMSDLFHTDIPDSYIAQVFAVMAVCPSHTFQVLTKRHGRMRSLLSSGTFRQRVWDAMNARHRAQIVAKPGPHWLPTQLVWPLPNVWVGVSTEDQKWADIRIPALLQTPAAVRFVSAEPLLGPIRLSQVLDWVIVGGESGAHARPMHPQWVRDLRDDTTAAGSAFFFKQWGEWAPGLVDGRVVHRWDDGTPSTRVGRKTAGRDLDGTVWDQYPTAARHEPLPGSHPHHNTVQEENGRCP